MIDSLFTLYCEDCEVAGHPSRLWVRAEIETLSSRGPETQHYLECMNCGFRFKSCMEYCRSRRSPYRSRFSRDSSLVRHVLL